MSNLEAQIDAFAAKQCPVRLRDDFRQEIWIGMLEEGIDAEGAFAAGCRRAQAWLERERRHERRIMPTSSLAANVTDAEWLAASEHTRDRAPGRWPDLIGPKHPRTYRLFLKSGAWAAKREECFDAWGTKTESGLYRCQHCCVEVTDIVVHHLRYVLPYGIEDAKTDLVPLCRECHVRAHESRKR